MLFNNIPTRIVFDRKHEATAVHTGLIQLEIRHDGKRKFATTGIKVYKNQFKNGKVVNRADADILNERLDTLYAQTTAAISEILRDGLPFSFQLLELRMNIANNQYTFLDFMQQRISERNISEGTRKQHRKVLRFLRSEYPHLTHFQDLTRQNIQRLDDYLHHRTIDVFGRLMEQSTIYTYHKIIRTYIHDAQSRDLIRDDPYARLHTDKGRAKPRVFLTTTEIAQFMSYSAPTPFIQKIKDLFIVQLFTGLAYTDLMATDFTKIEQHGTDYLIPQRERQKTGTQYLLYILPPVMEILQRYDYHIPHMAYDVYNRNLKAVAIAAGIKKTVTTHIARHTFATTVALGSGIPIEVVSKMLGHTNIQTTQIYAKILPSQVIAGYHKIEKSLIN